MRHLRHVLGARAPQHADDQAMLQQIHSKMNITIRNHLSPDMTIKMIMRPLDLPHAVQSLVAYPVTQIMNKVFLR